MKQSHDTLSRWAHFREMRSIAGRRSTAIVLTALLSSFAASVARGDDGKVSKCFGFDPEDSTVYLQRAFDSGRKKIIIDRRPTPWIANRLWIRSDQEIVFEDGAELVAKRGEFKSGFAPFISMEGSTNVWIHGKGTIRMWRDDYDKEPYEHAEWRHALTVGSCNRIRIEDLTIAESGGDGIYVGGAKPAENVVIRRVTCDRNYRQGISVTSARRLLIEDCVLSNTKGTLPQAGIDFEPNDCTEVIDKCILRRTVCRGNAGAGIDVCVPGLGFGEGTCSLLVEDCVVEDNAFGPYRTFYPEGAAIRAPTGKFEFRNLQITSPNGVKSVYNHVDRFGVPEGASELAWKRKYDYAAAKIMDDKKGQLVELSQPHVSGEFARFTFYAEKEGRVQIFGKQVPGWKKPPETENGRLVLTTARGRKIANLTYPMTEEVDFGVEVPEPGFYSLVARTGTSSICLTKADVPIALDLLWRKGLKRFPSRFVNSEFELYFPVPKKNDGLIFGACGENYGEWVRVELRDGGKKRLFDESFAAPRTWFSPKGEPAKEGLWRATFSKPEKGAFDNFSVDVIGVPQFFFLHPRRYWMQ